MLNLFTSLYISLGNNGTDFLFFSGLGQKVIRGGQDILTNLFWSIVSVLMTLVSSILDALINGVLGLDIFSNNTFISQSFAFTKALMFVIIPMKIVYELVSAMIRDDEAGLDVHKKLGSAFFGIMIACSLTVGITQVINPTIKLATTQLLSYNIITTDKSGTTTNNAQVGDTLIMQVLVGFGGMPEGGDYGAKELVKQKDKSSFDITDRYDADTDDGHRKYEYKWQYGAFTTIIGLIIYIVMLMAITVQIAVRMISIGFYYIIGPLACTSLTNYQNPQAFTVWRNTIVGQWAMNLSQIFLLGLMTSIINSISTASGSYPIACCAMYFGAFSLIISAPSFVQAMIGGYNAGILELLNSMKGGFGIAKDAGDTVVGAGKAVVGAGKLAYKGANWVADKISDHRSGKKKNSGGSSSGTSGDTGGSSSRANTGSVDKGMGGSSSGTSGDTGGASMNDFGQEASSTSNSGSSASQSKRRSNAKINTPSGVNATVKPSSGSGSKTNANNSMNRKQGGTVSQAGSGGSSSSSNAGGGGRTFSEDAVRGGESQSSTPSMTRNPATSVSTTSTGVGSTVTGTKSNLSVGSNISYANPGNSNAGITNLGNRSQGSSSRRMAEPQSRPRIQGPSAPPRTASVPQSKPNTTINPNNGNLGNRGGKH